MSEAPFTAAEARSLTDLRKGENRLMGLIRLDVFPILRASADRGLSQVTVPLGALTDLERAAVTVHLGGLGYKARQSLSNLREIVVSW